MRAGNVLKTIILTMVIVAVALPCLRSEASDRPLEAGQTAERISRLLDADAPYLSYDALMEIMGLIEKQPEPIPGLGKMLHRMAIRRNENVRVDQMILIFVARVIAYARFPIENVTDLFDTLLAQESRVNEWVVAFIADALGRYPINIEQGPRLVEKLQRLHRRVRQRDSQGGEIFGYHFLPPPKTAVVRQYIAGIGDVGLRQSERNLYYLLIEKGFREPDIAVSLTYLWQNGAPGTRQPCTPAMKCLVEHRAKIPFGTP